MAALWATLRKELLEQWRTSRLLIAVVVLTAFGFSAPLLAYFTPELIKMLPEAEAFAELIPTPTVNDAVAQYVENLSQFGTLLALLLTMGVVAQEKERGTAALMLSKPLPRWAFLLAKLVALGATFAVSLGLAAAAGYYYTYLLFEALPVGGWLALNALLWLMLMVFVTVTLLCSVLARSQVVAAALGFGIIIMFTFLQVLPPLAPYLPGHLLNLGMAVLLNLQQVLERGWAALWVSLALLAAAWLAAWLIFERQEL